MSEKNDFEESIRAILDADDSIKEKDSHNPIQKKSISESTPVVAQDIKKTKKYPAWATFVVRAIAGIVFILLLLKYAMNIAYR